MADELKLAKELYNDISKDVDSWGTLVDKKYLKKLLKELDKNIKDYELRKVKRVLR